MSLAELSIKRPWFITCLVVVMLAVGAVSLQSLPVDLFPDVIFPIVTVTTSYPGAGPSEIETLISKPLEDEISTVSGNGSIVGHSFLFPALCSEIVIIAHYGVYRNLMGTLGFAETAGMSAVKSTAVFLISKEFALITGC